MRRKTTTPKAKMQLVLHTHGIKYINTLSNKNNETYSLAIEDFHVPNQEQLEAITDTINDMLSHNFSVYIHCAAGIGRTSLVLVYYLLTKYNLSVPEAIRKMRNEYEGDIETAGQKIFLNSLGRGECKIKEHEFN